jgi:hypothetical protein
MEFTLGDPRPPKIESGFSGPCQGLPTLHPAGQLGVGLLQNVYVVTKYKLSLWAANSWQGIEWGDAYLTKNEGHEPLTWPWPWTTDAP